MTTRLERLTDRVTVSYGPYNKVLRTALQCLGTWLMACFQQIGDSLTLLLVGGTKRTQDEDIVKAKKLAQKAQSGS
jgi:putative component of toxin-antitoxin plasmid stabilization module